MAARGGGLDERARAKSRKMTHDRAEDRQVGHGELGEHHCGEDDVDHPAVEERDVIGGDHHRRLARGPPVVDADVPDAQPPEHEPRQDAHKGEVAAHDGVRWVVCRPARAAVVGRRVRAWRCESPASGVPGR